MKLNDTVGFVVANDTGPCARSGRLGDVPEDGSAADGRTDGENGGSVGGEVGFCGGDESEEDDEGDEERGFCFCFLHG